MNIEILDQNMDNPDQPPLLRNLRVFLHSDDSENALALRIMVTYSEEGQSVLSLEADETSNSAFAAEAQLEKAETILREYVNKTYEVVSADDGYVKTIDHLEFRKN